MIHEIIFLLVLFLFSSICLSIAVLISSNMHKTKLEELTLYQIHVQSQIDETVPEVLDLIIKESFNDYQLK